MQDFDTTTENGAVENDHENEETSESGRDKFRGFAKNILKRIILLVSFGPGVLGVVWLIGRILKR